MSAAIIPRLPDWAMRLDDLIRRRRARPFEWGRHDCAIFAADAVLAMTDRDLAAGLRGLGVRQALRHVRAVGGMCHLVPDGLPPLTHTALAIEGDIALIEQPARGFKRLALGVVVGGAVLGPARAGLASMPMHCAVQCWGVGHG